MRFSPPLFLLATFLIILFPGCSDKQGSTSGEKLFNRHCASCHPGGSNTITPSKTLKTADLQAGMITSPEDIIQKMRTPGPGMPRFTKAMIPEKEALQIAQYILKTFR
ncbi:MAG: c-type cytochrome [Deltaproteobacteria bacterium]|nr:c-type cytochrome [Deltaproteobacteria bacterium]